MRVFGHVSFYRPGDTFKTRIELAQSGVHKALRAGISGSVNEGADSIILSGGYEDDEDFGEVILYTGYGGRDLRSGKQVTDQQMGGYNLALARNAATGLPVRVIRGANGNAQYAPPTGYRYDGLYRVTRYWYAPGKATHWVWRYWLEQIQNEPIGNALGEAAGRYQAAPRTLQTVQRIVRDTAVGRQVKELYNYRCQVCLIQLKTNAGVYAEAAHVQPLGSPHNGPDALGNVLCLCPNHHTQLDLGGFSISDDLQLLGMDGRLTVDHRSHQVMIDCLRYHREHFYLVR